jgi:hypothetical protein
MVLAIPNSSALDAGAAAKNRSNHNTRLRGGAVALGLGIALGAGSTYYSKSSARTKQLKLVGHNARLVSKSHLSNLHNWMDEQ